MKIDNVFRIQENLRGRVYKALRGLSKKTARTIELLGCTIEELKIYISKLFRPSMSWDNYGMWHLDHIKPCSTFDLTKEDEQKKCFNYKNLQPLWADENLTKNDKYEELSTSSILPD